MMKRYVISLLGGLAVLLGSCGPKPFTAQERQIIAGEDSLMTVMVVEKDSAVLRTVCSDLSEAELQSQELRTLMDKMLYTVQHPSQDGVGIAAPQVGISRRVICVQRFDKEGEPFESYANIRIDSLCGEIVRGREGCLSIPGLRGMVPRHSRVIISYAAVPSAERRSESVEGFTSVIFQHECDHLDGILYTDRADSLYAVTE